MHIHIYPIHFLRVFVLGIFLDEIFEYCIVSLNIIQQLILTCLHKFAYKQWMIECLCMGARLMSQQLTQLDFVIMTKQRLLLTNIIIVSS